MTASGRAALAALGVVVTSFIAATAYSEYRAGSIDAAAHQLAESVAPGIQYLTNGCEDLRQLGALLREADARRDHVERSWQRAQAELETYLSLETTAESPRFAHQLAALQSMIGSAVGRWDPHDPAQQREVTGRILPAVEEISGTALVALDRAASHSRALAATIGGARRGALQVVLALDAVSLLFALLAAGLLWRTMRLE